MLTSSNKLCNKLRSCVCIHLDYLNIKPDPRNFEIREQDDILVSCSYNRLLSNGLALSRNCTKCSSNHRCDCSKYGVPCCTFCEYRTVEEAKEDCRNTRGRVVLNVPLEFTLLTVNTYLRSFHKAAILKNRKIVISQLRFERF